jgi:hypothetical protein
MTAQENVAIISIKKRRLDEGKETIFTLGGRAIPPEKISKNAKRKRCTEAVGDDMDAVMSIGKAVPSLLASPSPH